MQKSTEIDTLEKIISLLGLTASFEENGDDESRVITIVTDDCPLLIGYHGETLQALQLLVKQISFRQTGEWKPVVLDCGNYRLERVSQLTDLATRSAEKARFLSTTVVLPPMSSQDRREVHLVVQEISGVTSESVGYGRERHIEIRSEAMDETHPANLDETDYTDFAELSKPAQ